MEHVHQCTSYQQYQFQGHTHKLMIMKGFHNDLLPSLPGTVHANTALKSQLPPEEEKTICEKKNYEIYRYSCTKWKVILLLQQVKEHI